MNKISVYDSFDKLPQSVEKLFTDASIANGFFLSIPWFRTLHQEVCEINKTLRIYVVASENNTPRLALPLQYEKSKHRFFAPRRFTALGNFYTSLYSPVLGTIDSGTQEDLNSLANTIAKNELRWDTFSLSPMAIDGPAFGHVAAAFSRRSMRAHAYFCFGNWFLEVSGRSYQDYFATLPAKLKNTIERKSKQLENANRLQLRIFIDHSDLDEGIAAFEKVYASSWKKPEPYPQFMPAFIRLCAKEGWLRLGLAYIDKQPVAAQLWIVCNGVASIYKLAYDEKFSKFSIGSILTAHLMRHTIDVDRVQEVDYLTGDDPYKQDWMSHRRERWGIVVFNLRTARGVFEACHHVGGRLLNTVIKYLHRSIVKSGPALS